MTTRTAHISPDVELTVDEQGSSRPVLVLHGGGGPATVAGIATQMASGSRVLVVTLPGWNGTPRAASLPRIEDTAAAISRWLEQEDLRDVLVIGSSIGGWIAAELAIRDIDSGRITGVVLIDAVGFDVPGHPIRDFFALDARGVAEYSFHDSARFYVDPDTVPVAQQAVREANMATMKAVAGDPYMVDPSLLTRVSVVAVSTLVIWGDSDRIVTPEYGRAVAEAFGQARFEIIEDAGHLPHLEQPAAVFALIEEAARR